LLPAGSWYGCRAADGFIEKAVAIVGGIDLWDEIQQDFDNNLVRLPTYGTPVMGDMYGLIVLLKPTGRAVVFYRAIVEEQVIELVDILRA
jgi:plasmid stabilization system protein ParE